MHHTLSVLPYSPSPDVPPAKAQLIACVSYGFVGYDKLLMHEVHARQH